MSNFSELSSLSSSEKAVLFDEILGVIMKRNAEHGPLNVSKPSSSKKYEHVSSLSQEDEICFAALKKWRNQVAKDIDWPAYMVLDNKALMSIAHYKPHTDEELLKIKGLGPEKLGRYSNAIFDIVKSCSASTYQRKLPSKTTEKRFLGSNTLVYVSDDE